MTAHSKLGASSMYRWSACPGSVALIDKLAKSGGVKLRSSSYAMEGSAAHALAEHCLRKKIDAKKHAGKFMHQAHNGNWMVERTANPAYLGENPWISPIDDEMVEGVQVYLDYIRGLVGPGDTLVIEQKFDLSEVHPGCFGTADATIWKPKEALLIAPDFKYGAGIPVKVEGNPQLQYYALGALLASNYPTKRVRMAVVQPRCDHAEGVTREWEVDAVDLLDFRGDLQAYALATEAPNAALVPGDHCRFCAAAPLCPMLAQRAQEVAKTEFAPAMPYDPEKLKLALDSREPLKAWLKALDEFAYNEAIEGRKPLGYKLVDKRANRKWGDEGEVIDWLQSNNFSTDDFFKPRALQSPAQFEKEMSKSDFAELSGFIVKESSGLALVPDSDKRQAAKPLAKDEFKVLEST